MNQQTIAMQRYLQRHIEKNLPNPPAGTIQASGGRWHNVIVIPCFDEAPQFLSNFKPLTNDRPTLIILVINRPESCLNSAINTPLRQAIAELAIAVPGATPQNTIYHVADSVDLYCHDMEQISGPSPSSQGVGLARKLGCDIAIHWQNQGAISGNWICSTDADAVIPPDYFVRLHDCDDDTVVFPFIHAPGPSPEINAATALYELRLHHYVLGLMHAKSPYAYHTLGSCIAVKQTRYVQVRGYPKRAAGEDFYLLNKLAKLAPINSLSGECIHLQSRASTRVPFGTGPATENIIAGGRGDDTPVFYHPQSFEALRAVLATVDTLRQSPLEQLPNLLSAQGLCPELCQASDRALGTMAISTAIAHCCKQSRSSTQFRRQFDQWFDGFKTLKFIHAIREQGWAMQSLSSLDSCAPALFPQLSDRRWEIAALRSHILQQWNWASQALEGPAEN